ncbi:MAG: hypothetical protein ACRCX2_34910 [Paraclostridium sp.]
MKNKDCLVEVEKFIKDCNFRIRHSNAEAGELSVEVQKDIARFQNDFQNNLLRTDDVHFFLIEEACEKIDNYLFLTMLLWSVTRW